MDGYSIFRLMLNKMIIKNWVIINYSKNYNEKQFAGVSIFHESTILVFILSINMIILMF